MPKKQIITRTKKVYGAKTHYWREEIRPFIVATLCVFNALEFSTKASGIIYCPVFCGAVLFVIYPRPGFFVLPINRDSE